MSSPSLMLSELREQPEALLRLLDDAARPAALRGDLERASALLQAPRHIVLLGCGSSYHAAVAAASIVRKIAGVPVTAMVASEVVSDPTRLIAASHVIAVSQSGHTADTMQAMQIVKSRGLPSVAVLADGASPIARAADVALVTRAGTERAIPSTKGFTCQLATLWLMADAIDSGVAQDGLQTLPALARQTLDCEAVIANVARDIAQAQSHVFLGSGVGYAIAQEGALKMKESARVPAQAYPTFEVRHGPLAALGKDTPALLWHDNPEREVEVLALVQHLRACGVPVTVFAAGDVAATLTSAAKEVVNLPTAARGLAPIVGAVAFQILAYHVARTLNRNMDAPPHLVKSVI